MRPCATVTASVLALVVSALGLAPLASAGTGQRSDAYRLTRSTVPPNIPGGQLGIWSPLRETKAATITFEQGAQQNLLRLADPPDRAGYVTISALIAPQSIVRTTAKVALVRQFLRRAKVRALISVAGRDGTTYQAGVLRNFSGRLVWAVWMKTPDGGTVDLQPGPAARTGVWHTFVLTTRWGVRNARAVFNVDGKVAARTPLRDLSAAAAERVFIGLGRVSKNTETGVLLVRSAAVTGAAPSAIPGAGGGAGGAVDITLAPPPALADTLPGREVQRADFETGNLNQWSGVQRVSPDRIQVVRSPVRQGSYAGRFEVRNGDNPVDGNDRSEVSLATGESEGDEDWYAWSAMFDPTFPTLSGFQLITQWHTSLGGSPAMGVYVEGNDLLVQVNRFSGSSLLSVEKIWRGPLPRGRWLDLKFHIKWSSSDSAGWIEFWADGVRQTFDDGTQRRYIRNLKAGGSNYLKQGYYRAAGQSGTGVVYIDGFHMTKVN